MLAGTHGAAAPGPQSLWGARLRVPQLRADLAAGVGDDLPPACAAQLWDVLDAPGDGLLVHPGQRTLRAWQLFEEDGLRTQARPASCAGAVRRSRAAAGVRAGRTQAGCGRAASIHTCAEHRLVHVGMEDKLLPALRFAPWLSGTAAYPTQRGL